MSTDRWVLLGLARPRAAWFGELARWTTSAALSAEFVKCVSVEEVRTRLASGRPHSALLVDASIGGFDRDLVADATAASTVVVAVGDDRSRWSPADLGIVALLPPDFDREALLEVLVTHARPVGRADALPPLLLDESTTRWQGRLVAVCGPGGTGASTVAMAVAQAAAGDVRYGGRVVLADLARRADQAVLHEAPDLGPGLQELAEAHRLGRPGAEEVRASTFDVPRRGYRLLLGLRRPSAWSAVRPRAADATVEGLRQAFQLTVADVTGDVEGEADGGSIDVEERNHLARSVTAAADAVVVVGSPGLKGIHSLGCLLGELVASGVAAARLVPVVNRAPRHPRARAELSAALAVAAAGAGSIGGVVYLPERRVDEALRDGAPIPSALVGPVDAAVRHVLGLHSDAAPPSLGPERVVPGSLGSWAGSS